MPPALIADFVCMCVHQYSYHTDFKTILKLHVHYCIVHDPHELAVECSHYSEHGLYTYVCITFNAWMLLATLGI